MDHLTDTEKDGHAVEDHEKDDVSRSPRFRGFGRDMNIDIELENNIKIGFGDIARSLEDFLDKKDD